MAEPLTLAWLESKSHRACLDARQEFRRLYPGGKAPLHEVVGALADHPQGPEWFAWLMDYHPAVQPHRDAYAAALQTAWDAYRAARSDAWAALWAARQTVWATYDAALQTAWDAYDAAVRVAMRDVARKLTEGGGE